MRLAAALLLAGLAAAQDAVPGREAERRPSELAIQLQKMIEDDPSMLEALAQRILQSRLGERISANADRAARLEDIRRWIRAAPESAAQVAVGLAQDDAEGSRRFEESVLHNTSRSLAANPDHVRESTYGRLKRGSAESKLMTQDEGMSDEEKQETLKRLFEGRGGMSNQVITYGGPSGAGTLGAAGFSADYYDRLSQFNLRGYSPQLMAMQSALNQRRPPGAPKLVETGKLDYATLSYPAYGMRYDLENLGRRLRVQRNFALAGLAGLSERYSAEELLSPQVEALLREKSAGRKIDERFARRSAALERAETALRAFSAAAEAAQDPERISRGLLLELSRRQKEAARWITAASLEEELQRLDAEAGFLTPELLALIDGSPLPEAARSAYKRRGRSYEKALDKIKRNATSALARLAAEDWQGSVAAVEAALAENASLRRTLSRDIRDFTAVPYRLSALCRLRPRWRAILEDAVERWLPGTRWGKDLRGRRLQRDLFQDAFLKIAAGDRETAHSILASAEPAAPPER